MLRRSFLLLLALPLALAAQTKSGTKPKGASSNWKVLIQNTWVVDSIITQDYSRSGRRKTEKKEMEDKLVTVTITKDKIINSALRELDKESVDYRAIQDGMDKYIIVMGLALKVEEINKSRMVVKSQIPFFAIAAEVEVYLSPLSEQVKNMEKRLPGVWSGNTQERYRYRTSEYDYSVEYGYKNILALELKKDHSMKMITTTGIDSGKWELQSGELKLHLDGTAQDYLLYVNGLSDQNLVLSSKSKSNYGNKLRLYRSEYTMSSLRTRIEKDSVQAHVYREKERRRRDSIAVIEQQPQVETLQPPVEEYRPTEKEVKEYSTLVAGNWIAARYVDLSGGGSQLLSKEARLELYTNNTYLLTYGKKKAKGSWRRSQTGDFLLLEMDGKEVVAPFFLVKSWSAQRKTYEVQELQLTITLPGEKLAKRVLFKSLN